MDRAPAIIHVDMDAFYASVEILDRPELFGLPVIVGGGGPRSVVSAASYEARRFGVKSAMPVGAALRACPHAVVLPVRMERYIEVSRAVMAVFRRFSPLVEPLSLDEAFIDVTRSRRLFGDGSEIARKIRAALRSELHLAGSAGVSSTKLVAKIASDMAKPDGLLVVPPEEAEAFLAPLPVGRLWGVGPLAQKKLLTLGVRTVGEARALPREVLIRNLGKLGEIVFDFSRGIDVRTVEPPEAAKSIGREITFDRDISDREEALRMILALCRKTARRLRKRGVAGRTVTLKVRYGDFTSVTRSHTLSSPTDDAGTLYAACLPLAQKTRLGHDPVRLLGVSVSGLCAPGAPFQESLFDAFDPEKRKRLNRAVDALWDRFGEDAVKPAALLKDE
ncbi:MAG: DNA polymerase IV [Deltaproteobacteria bacterium]|nr:DNA polymerase IV [Deltaproteobacteria bacterium]